MMLLSHDSALLMAPLSQNSAVSLTPLCQLKLNFEHDLVPWRSGVIDSAESKLTGIITPLSRNLAGTMTQLSQRRHR
jgi:hypothetical protein